MLAVLDNDRFDSVNRIVAFVAEMVQQIVLICFLDGGVRVLRVS